MATQSPLSVLNNTQAAISTAENMGGIPVTETPTSAETTGPVVKGPTVKGGISVPGNVALDPTQTSELLANMQAMIDKRTGGWNDFMSGLQDTMALATPQRLGGPTQAMATRAQQKRQEQEDIFNMRAQMASLRSAQALADAQGKMFDQATGGGGGVAGGSGGAGAGGLNEEDWNYINSFASKAEKIAAWQDRMKVRSTERAKLINQPGYYEQKPYDTGRGVFMMSIPQIEEFKRSGRIPDEVNAPGLSGAAKGAPQMQSDFARLVERTEGSPDGSVSPKGATTSMQVMPDTALKPGYGVRPAADNSTAEVKRVGNDYADAMLRRYKGDQEAALIAYNAGPTVADKFLASNRDPAVLPKETIKYLARANVLQNEKPTQVASASTGTMSDAQPPVRRPGESIDAFKQRQEEYKGTQETRRQGLSKQVEATEKFLEGLKGGAEAANAKLPMVQHIEKHATEHPNEFYVSGQTSGKEGVLGAISNIRRFTGGEEKGKEAETAASPYLLSKEAVGRRKDTDTFSGQLAMGSSKELIGDSSVRLGAQIEKMFLDLKGLGTQSPAETNVRAAKMYSIMLERTKKQNDVAREYVAANPTATPNEIVNSPAYRAIDDWASNKLENVFGDKAKVTQQDMARREIQRRKELKEGAK